MQCIGCNAFWKIMMVAIHCDNALMLQCNGVQCPQSMQIFPHNGAYPRPKTSLLGWIPPAPCHVFVDKEGKHWGVGGDEQDDSKCHEAGGPPGCQLLWRIWSWEDNGELELGKDVSHNSPQQLNEMVDYSSWFANFLWVSFERTSRFPPVISILDSQGSFGLLQHSANGGYVFGSLAFIHLSPTHTWVTSSTIFSPFNLFLKHVFSQDKNI